MLGFPVWAQTEQAAGEPATVVADERPSTEKKLDDLPLRLTAVADKARHRWDPLNSGVLAKGTGCFKGAMGLTSGDSEFEVEEVWEDTENATYRMKGVLAGMKVERRILIDREIGAARYLDIFHNSLDADDSLVVTYKVQMSFAAGNIYTSRGKELTGKLGSRDFGLAIEAPADAGHPGVTLVLAHERSSLKPQVTISKDRKSLELDHRVAVKAGQRVAILTWVGQADFHGESALEEAFSKIYSGRKLVAPPVADHYLEMVVNFPATDDEPGGGAPYLVSVSQLCDRLQLDRDADTDKMRVENGSVLTGDATGGGLVIGTRFGDIEIPREQVAVLQGGAGRGRNHRVYLRDGTVYSGDVSVDGLGLKGGFEISLEMAQLDYLFYRTGERDGELPQGTESFVKLHTGEVLPVAEAGEAVIGFVSPWGGFDVKMSEIEWMRHVADPSPRYRVSLRDGSLLTVFLNPVDLELMSASLGAMSFGAAEMGALWGAEVELPLGFDEAEGVEEIVEIPKSLSGGACLLSGSNLIAGAIAQAELHVLTGSTVTKVSCADVVQMSRSGDGTELSPVFVIGLGGGDEISGSLQERVLDVRSGDRSWRVPVQHFLAMQGSGTAVEEKSKEAKKVSSDASDDR